MAKRRRRNSSKASVTKSTPSPKLRWPLSLGLAAVVLGLLGLGVWQWQRGQATAIAGLGGDPLEVTSLTEGADPANRTGSPADAGAEVSDLVRYLGPATNPSGLLQAESGAAGRPTLVFFHADW